MSSVAFVAFVPLPLSVARHIPLADAKPGAPLAGDHGAVRHWQVAPWVVGKSSSADADGQSDWAGIPGRC